MSGVKRGELYPVAQEDRHFLTSVTVKRQFPGATPSMFRARWTGEKRAPRAGEWYLSGGPVEAWRAPNNLTKEHLIAELVPGRVSWS